PPRSTLSPYTPLFRSTELHTSLLCIVLLTAYLLFFANDAYRRGIKLRDSRRQLGEQLAEITKLQSQLQEQAERDPLTGLHNRRLDRKSTRLNSSHVKS